MNCLYITLFFNTVAGIVQTFIKSWNQLLYPRVIACPLNHVMTSSCISSSMSNFSQRDVSLGEETSGNRWVRSPDCTADGPIYEACPENKNTSRVGRMTKRTSHLAGLWIGAAISNTSHSNKAGSTTVKRARLTGKGSRSTAVLPQ